MQGSSSGPTRRKVGEIVDVRHAPLQAICSECGAAYVVSAQQLHSDWSCPQCGPSVPLGSERPDAAPRRRRRRRLRRRLLPVLTAMALLLVSVGLLATAWWGSLPTRPSSASMVARAAPASDSSVSRVADVATDDRAESSIDSADTTPAAPAASVAPATELQPSDGATTETVDSEPLTLGRLLNDPKDHLNQQFRMDCRFVAQSQQTPTARLISGWEGDQAVSAGSAVGALELEDPSGIRVEAAFVAAESQAVSVLPWLLEGDRLQVVGTVVIRVDRQSSRPGGAFLVHEIQPAP